MISSYLIKIFLYAANLINMIPYQVRFILCISITDDFI